jgi:hypothetical protein
VYPLHQTMHGSMGQMVTAGGLPPLTPITPSIEPVQGSKTGFTVPHTPNTMTSTQFQFNYAKSPVSSDQTSSNCVSSYTRAHKDLDESEFSVEVAKPKKDRSYLNSQFKQFVSFNGQPCRNRFPLWNAPGARNQQHGNRRPTTSYTASPCQGRKSSGFQSLVHPPTNISPIKFRMPRRSYTNDKGGFYKAGDGFGKKKGLSIVDKKCEPTATRSLSVNEVQLPQTPPPTPASATQLSSAEPDLLQGQMRKIENLQI